LRISEEDYEYFRDQTTVVRDILERIDRRFSTSTPMTSRFLRATGNLLSEVSQMFFEEIKDYNEKKFDKELVKKFTEDLKENRGVSDNAPLTRYYSNKEN